MSFDSIDILKQQQLEKHALKDAKKENKVLTQMEVKEIKIKLEGQERDKNSTINNNKTNSVNSEGNIDSSKDRNIDGTIIINKTIDSIKLKRASYYLYPKTIKNIEKLAKESNKGISEFLQKFLDATLDKVKIE